MKQFYDNQDDNFRSKLTEHEFGMVPGAWDDMQRRLNQSMSPTASNTGAAWGAWFIIGAMVIATTVGIFAYQWQLDKTALPIADKEQNLAEPTESAVEEVTVPAQTPTVINTPIAELKPSAAAETTSTPVTQEEDIVIPPPVTPISNYGNSGFRKRPSLDYLNLTRSNLDNNPTPVVPTVAPDANVDDNSNQRQTALNSNGLPIYTRQTEVSYAFSSSTLEQKIRNNSLPSLRLENSQPISRNFVDTPMIVLERPYHMNAKDKTRFGISGGVNTKIYGSAGRFSVSPVVGVLLRHQVDSRFGLQAELQYKTLLQQSKALPLGSPQVYDLYIEVDTMSGAEVYYAPGNGEVYGIERMHFLELPLSILYNVHSKHQVSLGFKLGYLFDIRTASSLVNTYSNEELGFLSLDLGAFAGYEFAINDHLALNIVYNVGFMNLAKNTTNKELSFMSDVQTSYTLQGNSTQSASLQGDLEKGDMVMPIFVDESKQVFFKAPRNLYNSDLRLLLRYMF